MVSGDPENDFQNCENASYLSLSLTVVNARNQDTRENGKIKIQVWDILLGQDQKMPA